MEAELAVNSGESEDEVESEDGSSIEDSVHGDNNGIDKFLEVVKAGKGYVGVGDLVLYLNQLVCVVISICINAENISVLCNGINVDTMSVDDTSKLVLSPGLLVPSTISITQSLKNKLKRIKAEALESVHKSEELNGMDISYLSTLGFNRIFSFLSNKIKQFFKLKSQHTKFEFPYNFHVARYFSFNLKNNFCFQYVLDDQKYKKLDHVFGKQWDVHILENKFDFIRMFKVQVNLGTKDSRNMVIVMTKCRSTFAFDSKKYRELAIHSLHEHKPVEERNMDLSSQPDQHLST